jgi:HEXXH motif-containing protein
LHPGPIARSVLWPLVARRNLKRLLKAFAAARITGRATLDVHRTIISFLMELSDEQLDQLCTEPEVTSWLAGIDDPAQWDGMTYIDGLTPVIVAHAAAAAVDVGPLPVAVDDGVLTLRPLGIDVATTGQQVRAWSSSGTVFVSDGTGTTVITRTGHLWSGAGTRQLPRTYAGAVVKGLPHAWLRASFPDLRNVSADANFAAELADRVSIGLTQVERAWPEMAGEISSLLRWVVPMAEGDSFFVPAFRGLVALPAGREITQAFHVVHELSHNIMSCVYDLVDVVGNPDDRVRSPFSREVEPLSSVIHSCWAFSHELRAVRTLAAANLLDTGTNWDRLCVKIRIFYDRALPVIREHARLSSYGQALLEQVESIVYAA